MSSAVDYDGDTLDYVLDSWLEHQHRHDEIYYDAFDSWGLANEGWQQGLVDYTIELAS